MRQLAWIVVLVLAVLTAVPALADSCDDYDGNIGYKAKDGYITIKLPGLNPILLNSNHTLERCDVTTRAYTVSEFYDQLRALYVSQLAGTIGGTDGDILYRRGRWHKQDNGVDPLSQIKLPCTTGSGCFSITF